MEPLIVGLDLGTTLCKASAFTPNGTAVASVHRMIKTYRPFPGWAEQNPWEWWQTILEVLANLGSILGASARNIQAMGLSSQGPCVIPTNARFQALAPCAIWQDQRASDLVDTLIERVGEDWIGLGTPESSFGVQLYWMALNRPELLRQATHLFDTKGYLLSNLTGKAVDEPSSSPGGEGVNQSLFIALGVDLKLLAKSVPSLAVVGTLLPEIHERVGFPPGVKVVAGLNDGAAATLGAGVVELGQGIVSLSTNGVMRTTLSCRLPGATLRARSMFCYSYVGDLFVTGGMTKCGGDSVKWLIENLYQDDYGSSAVFDKIATEAADSPPGANGVVFMPYLLGMGTPEPTREAQGAFLNLARHHRRADLTRAVLEGAAFALRDIGRAFDELGLSWEELHFTGGGSKNPTWQQIVADILGKPLSGTLSDSVLGAALAAATSLQIFSNIKEAVRSMVSKSFHIEPIEENRKLYEQYYARFRRLKRLLSETSRNQD